MCLKSNNLSSLDHKIVKEASDGLQKAQKISGVILQSKEYLIKKAFDKIPSALQMISDALSISIYSDNLMAMKAEALLLLQRYEESYFSLGKLEEAHQLLKKYGQMKIIECRCGKQYQESVSSFSMTISELLRLKAAGNESFQSAYQALGQILDAIADCSLAIALDADYAKAFSRRSTLYELIRDYDQAANDIRRLIALLEKQLQENMSMPLEKIESIRRNLNEANLHLSILEMDAKFGVSSDMYSIL
ncbi:hypothetical protein HU200_056929 [Digitaria exilis]|uniref:Uncharacterized protein n=1 Tax=Digitaria exilis TaxID=1010633 RepID=A0A835AQH5_9POAL|nr:hypothetical protein HU200_056929 [Digitaria exilis]